MLLFIWRHNCKDTLIIKFQGFCVNLKKLFSLLYQRHLLADWFAQRTQDDAIVFTMFIDSDMIQVRTITDEIIPFQSGSAFY